MRSQLRLGKQRSLAYILKMTIQCNSVVQDVTWYLKIFNRKLMIWRCKNAIQTTVDEGRTLPLLGPYFESEERMNAQIDERTNERITVQTDE